MYNMTLNQEQATKMVSTLARCDLLDYNRVGKCYVLSLKNKAFGITYRALLLEDGRMHEELYPHNSQRQALS